MGSRRESGSDALPAERSRGSSFVGRDGSRRHRISSADYVITVSPSRRTSRAGSSSSLHQLPLLDPHADAASASDVEAGTTPPDRPPAFHASIAAAAAAAGGPAPAQPVLIAGRPPAAPAAAAAAAADSRPLLEPLLPPGDGPEAAAAEGEGLLQQRDGEGLSVRFDPFPATTAARAAAAQVARYRSLQKSAGSLRASLLARAESTAAAAAGSAAARFQRKLAFASGLSWVVNILLLVAKLYAYYVSQSKAVLASAADSAVDLVSQCVIAYAEARKRMEDPRFPVGQARLEAIGVLACACIMSVASFEVIQESVSVLWEGLARGELPQLELGLVMYLVLGCATGLKLVCWAVCAALQGKSDSMLALAEDHLNDILSNTCAILTAAAAGLVPNGWWIDPAGAIAISLYIVARWLAIAKQQVDKIVGRGAPAEFLAHLEELANSHHEAMGLDVMRAYHFGARYIVEMEVVLPAHMTVQESHDISLDLQHKVEQLEEVERCFVHVDYTRRDGLEHKVERELAIARALSSGSSGRLATPDASAGGAAVML